MSGAGVAAQISGVGAELGAQDGADAGHRFDDLGLRVGPEGLTDPRVQRVDALVELQQVHGNLSNDARGNILSEDGGVLRVGGLHSGRRYLLGARTLRALS